MKKGLSVVIPALNEQENLECTVSAVLCAVSTCFLDVEILIINDGSSDSTGLIADNLSLKDSRIRVYHGKINRGLGFAFQKGIALAGKFYISMVPGDNSFTVESLQSLFSVVGQNDIVAGFTKNQEIRPFGRQVVSKSFTAVLNVLFGFGRKYYNGPCVFITSQLKGLNVTTNGFAYMAEILIRLMQEGKDVVDVGLTLQEHKGKKSRAFSVRNVLGILKTLIRLFVVIRLLPKIP